MRLISLVAFRFCGKFHRQSASLIHQKNPLDGGWEAPLKRANSFRRAAWLLVWLFLFAQFPWPLCSALDALLRSLFARRKLVNRFSLVQGLVKVFYSLIRLKISRRRRRLISYQSKMINCLWCASRHRRVPHRPGLVCKYLQRRVNRLLFAHHIAWAQTASSTPSEGGKKSRINRNLMNIREGREEWSER